MRTIRRRSTRAIPLSVRKALAEVKPALEELYGERLYALYLYGSYARGDFRADSDIDILVVLRGTVNTGEEISRMNTVVSDICLRHNVLISVLPTTQEAFENGREAFWFTVREDLRPL